MLTLLAIAMIFMLIIVAGDSCAIGGKLSPYITASPSPALTGQAVTITGHSFNVSASAATGSFGDGSNYRGSNYPVRRHVYCHPYLFDRGNVHDHRRRLERR